MVMIDVTERSMKKRKDVVKTNTNQQFLNEMRSTHDLFKLRSDIHEIEAVLNGYQQGMGFDRQKAEEIIQKHNHSDIAVATYNSPIRPGWITFEQASDVTVYCNLVAIRNILLAELKGKSVEEIIEEISSR